jgi:hypothetical protein
VSVDEVQALIDAARGRRSRSWRLSLAHGYYAGVETAAWQVLHPEAGALGSVGWLDRHNPGFVSGYVETTARLASRWSAPLESPEPRRDDARRDRDV